VVLLHGYVGDGSTTWPRQLEAFADEFTVITWDAPGAGRSSDPAENFGIAGYAECLARFITALGLRLPHVAGLSFGGIVALELCRRRPAVLRSLILASAYAGWAGSLPADVAAQRLRQALTLSELSAEQFVATLLPTMFSVFQVRASRGGHDGRTAKYCVAGQPMRFRDKRLRREAALNGRCWRVSYEAVSGPDQDRRDDHMAAGG
jgi:pimeloyl-ACP methyl ester carboxylesterase